LHNALPQLIADGHRFPPRQAILYLEAQFKCKPL
jgi:hypothetical protein